MSTYVGQAGANKVVHFTRGVHSKKAMATTLPLSDTIFNSALPYIGGKMYKCPVDNFPIPFDKSFPAYNYPQLSGETDNNYIIRLTKAVARHEGFSETAVADTANGKVNPALTEIYFRLAQADRVFYDPASSTGGKWHPEARVTEEMFTKLTGVLPENAARYGDDILSTVMYVGRINSKSINGYLSMTLTFSSAYAKINGVPALKFIPEPVTRTRPVLIEFYKNYAKYYNSDPHVNVLIVSEKAFEPYALNNGTISLNNQGVVVGGKNILKDRILTIRPLSDPLAASEFNDSMKVSGSTVYAKRGGVYTETDAPTSEFTVYNNRKKPTYFEIRLDAQTIKADGKATVVSPKSHPSITAMNLSTNILPSNVVITSRNPTSDKDPINNDSWLRYKLPSVVKVGDHALVEANIHWHTDRDYGRYNTSLKITTMLTTDGSGRYIYQDHGVYTPNLGGWSFKRRIDVYLRGQYIYFRGSDSGSYQSSVGGRDHFVGYSKIFTDAGGFDSLDLKIVTLRSGS